MKRKNFLCILILVLIVAMGYWYASSQRESGTGSDEGQNTDPNPPTSGWVTIDGTRHYYLADGTAASGWVEVDGKRCYFLEGGIIASGWVTIDGNPCYFGSDGTPCTGWQDIDGSRYYLDANGFPLTGTQQLDGKTYVFDTDGTFYTGWVTIDGNRYYAMGDGTFATSPLEIDGEMCYFTPSGIHVVLVNPWTPLPAEQQTDLLPLDSGFYVAVECYEPLNRMLSDCAAAGYTPAVCSAYRTQEYQEYLYQRKVDYYLAKGCEQDEAEELAGTVVAVPGTSEHQLGLAVDLIEEDYPYLNEQQAETETQKWLMEHCWEYGFILRYPTEASDITGIIYEPWHYRYVGVEIAQEIHALGITLEEYLGFTHE